MTFNEKDMVIAAVAGRVVGAVIGTFLGLSLLSAVIYFGWNFVSPVSWNIPSFSHTFAAVFLFHVLRNLIRKCLKH